MGRSILHRKVLQNRNRERNPGVDHLMAAAHYDAPVVELPEPPAPPPTVQELLARIAALEAKSVSVD